MQILNLSLKRHVILLLTRIHSRHFYYAQFDSNSIVFTHFQLNKLYCASCCVKCSSRGPHQSKFRKSTTNIKSVPFRGEGGGFDDCWLTREDEGRVRIHHTWAFSNENYLKSIFGSVSYCVVILRTTPVWSVRMTSCNFRLLTWKQQIKITVAGPVQTNNIFQGFTLLVHPLFC